MKKRAKLVVITVTMLAVLIVGLIIYFVGLNNNNNNEKETNNNVATENKDERKTEVKEELFEKLSLEGMDEQLNSKVKDYINNDGKYYIYDEFEHNGYRYKGIQITFAEHKHDGNFVAEYLMKDEEINALLLRELEDDRILAYDEGGKIMDELYKVIFGEFEHKVGGTLTFERYKNFEFVEDWSATAIVRYDINGNVDKVVAYEGAVGSCIKTTDNGLEWNISILDKMDCYYYGMYQWNGETKTPITCCLLSGTMYTMMLDNVLDVEKIYDNGDTINNTLDNLCVCAAVDDDYYVKAPAVKNYNLYLSDFIENEEYKDMLINQNSLTEDTRKMFGCQHETSYYGWDGDYYFTKDGYVIQTGRVPTYAKMDIKEVYDIDRAQWYELFKDNLFVGELNKEFEYGKLKSDNEEEKTIDAATKEELSKELKDEEFCQ